MLFLCCHYKICIVYCSALQLKFCISLKNTAKFVLNTDAASLFFKPLNDVFKSVVIGFQSPGKHRQVVGYDL